MAIGPYNATALIVDNLDPSIVYSSFWFPQGSGSGRPNLPASVIGGDVDPDYMQSVHLTQTNSETAIFSFSTGIEVFGSIGPKDWGGFPVSRYTLETNPTVDYKATPNDQYQVNVSFFKSPILDDGHHTLLITNRPCQTLGQSCKFLLDYVVYTPSSTVSVSSLSTAPSTLPPSQTGTDSSSSSSKVSVGVIVGPVIGGIVLLSLIGTLFIWYARRLRRQYATNRVNVLQPELHRESSQESITERNDDHASVPGPSIVPYTLTRHSSGAALSELPNVAGLTAGTSTTRGPSSSRISKAMYRAVSGTENPADILQDAPPAYTPRNAS
ncbi:unnamed protein product [Somion occarium]|uniref:Uncharacterized protein n=1 Tax=Somion occarium TaxID=3059160 RepID=A0ABP1DQK3_9APHY